MSIQCDICGTKRKAQRSCCREEFTRLRRKNAHLHDLLDTMEVERDRYAKRVDKLENGQAVVLEDPWAEPDIASMADC